VDGYEVCNPISHRCEVMNKTCSNSCSGHGDCVYVSRYNLSEMEIKLQYVES